MKILTVDDIITELQGEGLHLTRETFKYYSKIGLFFAQERKTKKRLREGIISLYAEEVVARVSRILRLKAAGFTLEEVKECLAEADTDSLRALYSEAGLEACLEEDIGPRLYRWMTAGYYRGQLSIYDDLLSTLKAKLALQRSHAEEFDKFKSTISWQISHNDKSTVDSAFERKSSSLRLGVDIIEKSLLDLKAKREDLGTFLADHVERYKPHSSSKKTTAEQDLADLQQKEGQLT